MDSANNNGLAGLPLSDRAVATWEIVSLVSSALIAEWILAVAAGRTQVIVIIPVVLAFGLIIPSHIWRRETLTDLGFRWDNFASAAKLLLIPMVAAAIVCFVIGYLVGGRLDIFRWHAERELALQLGLGTLWGLVQQYVLQGFLNRRAQIIWGRGPRSVLFIAVVFAALHLPNPWLMLATFVGGLVWAAVYQRAPNLFALAVSHSIMTWVVVSTLPPAALNHLRIGFKYFS